MTDPYAESDGATEREAGAGDWFRKTPESLAMLAEETKVLDESEERYAEVERLRRWKAEATEVILGLQDLGKALDLPLGERITATAATEVAKRLKSERDEATARSAQLRADVGDWVATASTHMHVGTHGECFTCKSFAALHDILIKFDEGGATAPEPDRAARHNHVTRDIKPRGVCPACDRYHEVHP